MVLAIWLKTTDLCYHLTSLKLKCIRKTKIVIMRGHLLKSVFNLISLLFYSNIYPSQSVSHLCWSQAHWLSDIYNIRLHKENTKQMNQKGKKHRLPNTQDFMTLKKEKLQEWLAKPLTSMDLAWFYLLRIEENNYGNNDKCFRRKDSIQKEQERSLETNQLSSRIVLQNVYPVNVPVKVKYEMKDVTLCCLEFCLKKLTKTS